MANPKTGPVGRSIRLAGMVLCLALGGALAYFALYTVPGQALDVLSLHGTEAGQKMLFGLDSYVLDTVSTQSLIVVMGLAALVAVVRRRWALASRAVAIIIGANLTTRVLKLWVLSRPYLGVDLLAHNSLPSGHTTAALTAALALLLVVPHRWRDAMVWLGWIFVGLMGTSVLVNGWHRLADVLVAICVGGFFGFLGAPVEIRRGAKIRFNQKVFGLLSTLLLLIGLAAGIIGYFNLEGSGVLAMAQNLRALAPAFATDCLGVASVCLTAGLSGLLLRQINLLAR